jgi:hypothetical protein
MDPPAAPRVAARVMSWSGWNTAEQLACAHLRTLFLRRREYGSGAIHGFAGMQLHGKE